MLFDLTVSWFDYMGELSRLLRDPLYLGDGIPHGCGEAVMLIPGFFVGDAALALMAGWLRRIGYSPYLSGIDLNVGCPASTAQRLRWRVEQIVEQRGAPAALVGHSLGGVLARALGAEAPGLVKQVVTLGTPMRNDWSALAWPARPFIRSLAGMWGASGDCGTIRCGCGLMRQRAEETAGGLRFSSIYSRRDEVVDWRSCVDEVGRNYEVGGRHFGLLANREVYRLIAWLLQDADVNCKLSRTQAPAFTG